MVQHSHTYVTTRKTIALTRWTFVSKVISLLFNMLSRFVIAFLPWSNHLLISWLQSPSIVILEPRKIKPVTIFIFSPSICPKVVGTDAVIFIFLTLSFKPAFSLFSFTLIKRLFDSSSLYVLRVGYHLCIWGCCCFSWKSWFQLEFVQCGVSQMCSAHKLNKQGDDIRPCHTLVSVLNWSFVPCLLLSVATWPAYRLLT